MTQNDVSRYQIESKLSPLSRKVIAILGIILVIFLILSQDFQLPIFGIFLVFFGFSRLHAPSIEGSGREGDLDDLAIKKSFRLLKLKYIGVGIGFGLLVEFLAVLNNLRRPPEERILFHPDPVIDMILSIAYYLPVVVVAALIIFRFNFNLLDVFIAGGIYGICTEQNFAILLSFNFLYWGYVFLVYGSFMGLPYVVFRPKIQQYPRKQMNRILKIGIFVIIVMLSFVILSKLAMAGLWILLDL